MNQPRMTAPRKSREKDKANYDAIRKLHMKNVQKINDLYIESQIAVEGLELELDRVKGGGQENKGKI
jgi:hypothetical protein